MIINPKVNLKVITMKVFINKLVRKRENVGQLARGKYLSDESTEESAR